MTIDRKPEAGLGALAEGKLVATHRWVADVQQHRGPTHSFQREEIFRLLGDPSIAVEVKGTMHVAENAVSSHKA